MVEKVRRKQSEKSILGTRILGNLGRSKLVTKYWPWGGYNPCIWPNSEKRPGWVGTGQAPPGLSRFQSGAIWTFKPGHVEPPRPGLVGPGRAGRFCTRQHFLKPSKKLASLFPKLDFLYKSWELVSNWGEHSSGLWVGKFIFSSSVLVIWCEKHEGGVIFAIWIEKVAKNCSFS